MSLANWAEDKGRDGISDYWETRNQSTIDGDPTFILAPAEE